MAHICRHPIYSVSSSLRRTQRLSRVFIALTAVLCSENVFGQAQDPAGGGDQKRKIVVEVAGEVESPGVQKHPEGTRVWDAIHSAGGATDKADMSDINLAAPLMDATRLYIPAVPVGNGENKTLSNRQPIGASDLNPPEYTRSGWLRLSQQSSPVAKDNNAASAGVSHQKPAEATPGLINLNTASKAELESLPGIGPVTADKIIAFRDSQPFKTVDDLEKVPGIGPAKMGAVRDLVTVK